MTEFKATEGVTYGGSIQDKQDAMALDFLKAGKTMDFVIANVCGKDLKAISRALKLGKSTYAITGAEYQQYLNKFKIDDQGKKKK
jgi:hypothetical protein